jgi:hypothetical protein
MMNEEPKLISFNGAYEKKNSGEESPLLLTKIHLHVKRSATFFRN